MLKLVKGVHGTRGVAPYLNWKPNLERTNLLKQLRKNNVWIECEDIIVWQCPTLQ